MDLGKRAQTVELDHHNEEEGDGYPQAICNSNTITAPRHSQGENIFTGTAIESTDAYNSIMSALGGDETTYPPPPTRPPPPVPTKVACAEHEVTMADGLERHSRPQTRSTQRSSSDESLRLSNTRSAQSTAGGHSRRTSNDTITTSLYSIEECTEYTDTSGIDKAIDGKTFHQQADADSRRDQDSLEASSNGGDLLLSRPTAAFESSAR